MRKEKSIRGSLFAIKRLCQVMPNSDPEGHIFLSAPNNHDRFFILHTFHSPAFDFNVGVAIYKSRCLGLTYAKLMSKRLSYLTLYPTYVLTTRVVISFFIYPMGQIRVCKIRFVSTGENCGKPCLVCKKAIFFIPDKEIWGFRLG